MFSLEFDLGLYEVVPDARVLLDSLVLPQDRCGQLGPDDRFDCFCGGCGAGQTDREAAAARAGEGTRC